MENDKSIDRYVVFRATFDQETTYHKLKLPSAFTKYIKENFTDEVYLRDQYENMWPSKMEYKNDEIYFHGGWRSYAKHNYIEDGDSMVFGYGGANVFDVKVLGSDCFIKKGIGRCTFRKEGEVRDFVRVDEGELEDKKRKFRDRESIFEHHVLSKRGKSVDPFGYKLFKSQSKRPKNPFFVTLFRKDRKHALLIPKRIVKMYKLDLPEKIVLKDSKGGEWDANLHVWKDGRPSYSGGWMSLCEENHIDEEDTLICEFLRSEETGLYIQVNVFHPGSSK